MTRNTTAKHHGHRKNARHSANHKQSNSTKWFWFVMGLVCGVVLTLVVDVRQWTEKSVERLSDEIIPHKGQQTAKPRFDFYTLLRESEVIVADTDQPAADIPVILPTPEADSTTVSQPSEIYLLQVGSFRNASDADSLRAGLLLLNLQASIEKVSPRAGEVWHRVLVGPMTTGAEVASARKKLASSKIDSLLLKRKP